MKRLIHTYVDFDNFNPICGADRDSTGIQVNPVMFAVYERDYEDKLFRVCLGCLDHEDLPLIVLAYEGL